MEIQRLLESALELRDVGDRLQHARRRRMARLQLLARQRQAGRQLDLRVLELVRGGVRLAEVRTQPNLVLRGQPRPLCRRRCVLGPRHRLRQPRQAAPEHLHVGDRGLRSRDVVLVDRRRQRRLRQHLGRLLVLTGARQQHADKELRLVHQRRRLELLRRRQCGTGRLQTRGVAARRLERPRAAHRVDEARVHQGLVDPGRPRGLSDPDRVLAHRDGRQLPRRRHGSRRHRGIRLAQYGDQSVDLGQPPIEAGHLLVEQRRRLLAELRRLAGARMGIDPRVGVAVEGGHDPRMHLVRPGDPGAAQRSAHAGLRVRVPDPGEVAVGAAARLFGECPGPRRPNQAHRRHRGGGQQPPRPRARGDPELPQQHLSFGRAVGSGSSAASTSSRTRRGTSVSLGATGRSALASASASSVLPSAGARPNRHSYTVAAKL